MGCHKIVLLIAVGNVASERIAQRLGFTYGGILRDDLHRRRVDRSHRQEPARSRVVGSVREAAGRRRGGVREGSHCGALDVVASGAPDGEPVRFAPRQLGVCVACGVAEPQIDSAAVRAEQSDRLESVAAPIGGEHSVTPGRRK